ncbi:MAG: hypothetical protein B0W54_19490 [Cellvibrio sp. 79]|nr:MAG: hypothetical protein B0W54_19490 [Cellvibrio sp. 79]
MFNRLLLLCVLPTLGCRFAYGSETIPSNTEKTSEIPTIEEIKINVHPVFDESNPKENNIVFRLINRLHINTKKQVIEKDLTFKKGDVLDKKLMEESERRLRERRYFAKAKITVVDPKDDSATPNNQVQVDVREVWTLIPKISYSNAGGKSHYGYGLHDSNFLGLGKTVKIEQTSTEERTSNAIVYRDPNFGADKQLALAYADNSDGKEQEFHFSNPFRSVRTPWTVGIDVKEYQREDTLFNAGDEAWRFGHDGSYYSVFYGQRLNSSTDNRTHRWTVGWDKIADDFYVVPQSETNFSNEPPKDRDYNIAWIEYAYLHNRFFEAVNVQQINRIEDINLGSQWRARVGSVMANDEQLDKSTVVQLDYSKAYRLSPNQLLTTKLSTSGFYSDKKSLHSISQADLTYHWQNFARGQFYILANEIYGNNLFADMPLELGGDTGLRGYPARFMAGDRSRLLTVEQRYFGETEWFSLFHVGAAVFYDQGKVWGSSNIPQNYQQTLRDVGIGLRISGTRTGGRDEGAHNVAHIDLAYPLDGGNEIDKYQISVKIKTGF